MITSHDNPKIKHIRALLTQKKARDEHHQYLLENERFITDHLKKHPEIFDSLFYTNKHSDPLLESAKIHHIPCHEVSTKVFQTLHSVKTSFGIIAVLNKPKTMPPKTFKKALYLDGINKPQNLGAIIRSAAAFSLDIVFLSPETCDPFHPESIRASAGHLHAIPMVTLPFSNLITTYPNLSVYCLSEKADLLIQNVTFQAPSVFVMGSETGFSTEVMESDKPKTLVKIPMNEAVDSLNVAVAAGIVLWSFRE